MFVIKTPIKTTSIVKHILCCSRTFKNNYDTYYNVHCYRVNKMVVHISINLSHLLYTSAYCTNRMSGVYVIFTATYVPCMAYPLGLGTCLYRTWVRILASPPCRELQLLVCPSVFASSVYRQVTPIHHSCLYCAKTDDRGLYECLHSLVMLLVLVLSMLLLVLAVQCKGRGSRMDSALHWLLEMVWARACLLVDVVGRMVWVRAC